MSGAQVVASHPFVTRSGEGTALWHTDNLMIFKAVAAATGNRLAVWEQLLPRHSSPPLHVHHRDDEAWYVLDGSVTFRVEDNEMTAAAGDFVWAPRGLPHSFRVESQTARVLGARDPRPGTNAAPRTGRRLRHPRPTHAAQRS